MSLRNLLPGTLLALGLAFSTPTAQAADGVAPPAPSLTYQGRLVESGIPVTGNRSFVFALIDSAGAGLWTSPTTTVAVSDGLYAVIITGFPSSAIASPGLKLRVTVGTTTVSPDVALVPSLQAITAFSVTPGAVGTPGLVDGAVTSDKIADTAVTTAKVADGAVTSTKIASGTIAEDRLDVAVQTKLNAGGVADGGVTTVKIADSAVTTAKVADGAVTSAKIATGTIAEDRLAAAVQTKLNAGGVADGGVTTVKIADSAVTTAKVADGAITSAKLAADVLPLYVAVGNYSDSLPPMPITGDEVQHRIPLADFNQPETGFNIGMGMAFDADGTLTLPADGLYTMQFEAVLRSGLLGPDDLRSYGSCQVKLRVVRAGMPDILEVSDVCSWPRYDYTTKYGWCTAGMTLLLKAGDVVELVVKNINYSGREAWTSHPVQCREL